MILPSTVGDQPTRGVRLGGPPGPPVAAPEGLSLAMAALPAALSAFQSIFCSAARSFLPRPSSFINWRASSRDCSLSGRLLPPPDCADARWNKPSAEAMPIRHVTLAPPPDWP